MSFVAFISYKHSDTSRPHAERLEAALKRYSKPLWKPPVAIFRDERVLQPGADLPSTIRKALTQSEFLLYLASAEAARSLWVQDELRTWCEELGRADRLLIVHIGDRITCDPARGTIVWEETDALPRLLEPYLPPIPVWTDLSWANNGEQRDLNNVDYKKAVNAITARFRSKSPGEMNDEEVLTHRRNVRLRNFAIVVVVLFGLLATFFGDQARRQRNAAERERNAAVQANQVAQQQRRIAEARARKIELAEAFRMMDRGTEKLRNDDLVAAKGQFDGAARLLSGLGLDPMMPLHAALVADARVLKTQGVVDVEGEVSFVRASRNGDLLAVVYDYQNFGGNPEIEDIPDKTAVGLYNLSTRQRVLRQTVGSTIGRLVYGMYPGDVVGVDQPHDLILRRGNGTAKTLVRFSLADGKTTPCTQAVCGEYEVDFERSSNGNLPESLRRFVDPSSLFSTHPDDGIDVEYGPRLVDKVSVAAPDGRTQIVGTYEGRLLLLDRVAGIARGEGAFQPIYAAGYRHDGTRAYVADRSQIFEVDTSEPAGIREVPSPLKTGTGETVLATAFADDASLVAIATTRHLLGLLVAENRWVVWELPKAIGGAAALRADVRRHAIDLVVSDDGTVVSGDYRAPSSALKRAASAMGKPVVAWLDPEKPAAWMCETATIDGAARVSLVPLPGHTLAGKHLSVRLVENPSDPFERPPVMRGIAQFGDRLVLFHGDAEPASDNGMRNEAMTAVSLSGKAPQTDRVLFEAKRKIDNLGAAHWTRESVVTAVLPESRADRLLVRAGGAIYAVGADAAHLLAGGALSWRDYTNQDQAYALQVGVERSLPRLSIQHEGSKTTVQVPIPWMHRAQPKNAVIGPGGHQVAVVSTMGDVTIVDAPAFAARRGLAKISEMTAQMPGLVRSSRRPALLSDAEARNHPPATDCVMSKYPRALPTIDAIALETGSVESAECAGYDDKEKTAWTRIISNIFFSSASSRSESDSCQG